MESFYNAAKRYLSFNLALAALCAAFIFIAAASVRDESLTVDEITHIPSGYMALKEHNFITNLDHPPLLKMIAAVPLLFQEINYRFKYSYKNMKSQILEGKTFFLKNTNKVESILFSARVTLIIFHAFLLFILGSLLKNVIQPVFAWIAVFFIAFEPTFLAHVRYVNTDAGAAVFTLLSLVTFGIFLRSEKRLYIWLTAIFLGAALLSKFSGLLVYLFILVYMLFKRCSRPGGVKLFGSGDFNAALILIMPLLIVYLVYFGATFRVNPQHLTYVTIHGSFAPETMLGKNIFIRPVVLYLVGIEYTYIRSNLGERALPQYLNGEVRENKGWWYYFPLALYYKETPVLLLLFALGLILYRRENQPLEKVLLLYSGLYFIMAVTRDLNIGIRHILPMISSLTLLSVMVLWQQRHRQIFSRMLYIAAAFQLFIMLGVYPDYTAYFNVFAGGPANGYKHLSDSNLEWGQSFKRLCLWAKENKIDSMMVERLDWNHQLPVLFDNDNIVKRQLPIINGKPVGYLAINVQIFQLSEYVLPDDCLYLDKKKFEEIKPDAIVGHAYWVYHLQ
ncbi:MAG: phospholipid carrier-dependent glycosyltransferase [Candidatus Magnetominusculus sp. LBB02]|nr:phospholipid carrier-dependent glycosyltransferase [Candidatus Magnetominusculus sp. LBB02]